MTVVLDQEAVGVVQTNPLALSAIITPTTNANRGFLYGKTVSGRIELHYLDSSGAECQLTDGGAIVTDHGGLTGLADDDHTQYALLAGRVAHQNFIGSTAASGTLTLQATASATAGSVIFKVNGTTEVGRFDPMGVFLRGRVSRSSTNHLAEFFKNAAAGLIVECLNSSDSVASSIIFRLKNNAGDALDLEALATSHAGKYGATGLTSIIVSRSTQTGGLRIITQSTHNLVLGVNSGADIIISGTSGNIQICQSGNNLGFFGGAPAAQAGAYTQTYATADRTLGAYTPDDESGAYTGIDNAQGGVPYAEVADLNALRVGYENLRAFVEDAVAMENAIVDDLQAYKLLQ